MASSDSLKLSTSLLTSNIFNEQYLYNINRDDFTKVSSTDTFNAEFKNKIFTEDHLYIITGTDSGLLPKYIQQHGIPSGTRYLFIEPDQTLIELHQHNLLNALSSEIVVTTYNEWEQCATILKIEQYCYINSIRTLSALCAQQDYSEEYTEISWQVNEKLPAILWRYGTKMSTETFMVRQIENIQDEQTPIKLLENAYQGMNAIILAGGPSLNEALPWVKENRNNLVVFSVARISRQLLNNEITPDFVLAIDPNKISLGACHELLSFNDRPIFIHSHHVYPDLLNQWHGKSLYLGNRLPWDSPLNIDNIQGVGPTVTNTALSVAHYLGFDTIFLAGVDLCHSKNGTTHAHGSEEQLAGPKYNTTSLQVVTYNNDYRNTTEDYLAALQTLSFQAQQIITNKKTIINLSKDAAKAEGIEYISVEKNKLITHSETAREIADRALNCSEKEINKNTYYIDVISELKKAKHHINSIKDLAIKARHINNKMYNNEGIIENYKDKKHLDKIEKTLNKKHRPFGNLVKNFGIRQFIKITTPHDENRLIDAEKAKQIGDMYYSAYQGGASQLLNLIDLAILRIKSRQEEEKEYPDFPLLFKRWGQDHSYKRATLWQENHPNYLLDNNNLKKIQLFSDKFHAHIKQANSTLESTLNKNRSNVNFLKNKIKISFKGKKLSNLKELKEAFLLDDKNKNKKDFLFLISAYIAELEGNNDSALDFYHQIINTEGTTLLEDALTKITSISIEKKDHQNAFLALECLASISPIYLPYYAESARIQGETLLAIDSYMTYLNLFPSDIITQLKLVSLYIYLEIYEAAEFMLDLILKNAPTLDTALILKKEIKSRQSLKIQT